MSRVITKGKEAPPLTFGPQRLHYQYSVGLPQMHLSFVSVLQGLVFGVLLLGVPLPNASALTDLGAFEKFVLAQHGYLAYLVSSLLILVIWAQYAQNSLSAIWPLSSGQLGLSLLLSVAELLAVRAIGDFGLWLTGLGAIGVIGGVIRLNNLRLQAPQDYESPMLAERRRRPWDGLIYVGLGLLTAAGGIGFLSLPQGSLRIAGVTVQQASSSIEWIALGMLSVVAAGIVALDRHQRRLLLQTALEDSDLMVTRLGVIRYRPEVASVPTARQAVVPRTVTSPEPSTRQE
jgi:hypothetical protein